MTDARSHILNKLARVIDRAGGAPQDVTDRLSAKARGPVPLRGLDPEKPALTARFVRETELAGSDLRQLPTVDAVPTAVASYLRAKSLPPQVRVSSDRALSPVPWDQEPGLTILGGGVVGDDTASLSVAFAGVAETGTLVMSSAPVNPAMYGFVPFVHMVLLPESRVTGNYEAVWAQLRQHQGPKGMPRMVNMITGPSRTADIEQTLLMGAHGPQNLLIMIVEDL